MLDQFHLRKVEIELKRLEIEREEKGREFKPKKLQMEKEVEMKWLEISSPISRP